MARKTPEQRFKEVAVKRANRAIEALRLLSHCSSLKNYRYSRDAVGKIFQRIEDALSSAKSTFTEKSFDEVEL